MVYISFRRSQLIEKFFGVKESMRQLFCYNTAYNVQGFGFRDRMRYLKYELNDAIYDAKRDIDRGPRLDVGLGKFSKYHKPSNNGRFEKFHMFLKAAGIKLVKPKPEPIVHQMHDLTEAYKEASELLDRYMATASSRGIRFDGPKEAYPEDPICGETKPMKARRKTRVFSNRTIGLSSLDSCCMPC